MIPKDLKSIAVVRENKLIGVINRIDFLSSLIESSEIPY